MKFKKRITRRKLKSLTDHQLARLICPPEEQSGLQEAVRKGFTLYLLCN